MLHLTDGQRLIVEQVLREHVPECEVWAFGSRVHGRHLKRFSDLDLALVGCAGIANHQINALQIAFSDSDLPFRVDLVELDAIDPDFRRVIEQAHAVVQHRDTHE
jgi:predicted nucleotidyltransferase